MPDTPDKQQLSEWKDADNLRKVYSSDLYRNMPGKDKYQYEKHLYDTHIIPNFKASGKTLPTFDKWLEFRTSGKFNEMGSKMYDYFEPRDSSTERMKDYGTRVARSFTGLAESLYNRSLGQIPSYNKATGKWKHDSTVSNWLANAKAAESKIIDKNSPVEAGLTRKFFESLSDMSSDFPVWNAVSEVTPALAQITKVKGVDRAVVSGLLGKLNLTQDLAQSKLGRFAMNRLISAAQVFTVSNIEGGQHPIKDAIVGSVFPQHSNPEIKKYLAEQVNMMGPKATNALLEAAKDLSKNDGDPLTQKLTEANASIYNKLARTRGYSMYNTMPKDEKKYVIGIIQSNLKEVLDHPLANASPELQKFLVESHVSKNITLPMLEGFKASAEASAKQGQKPSMDGLVKEQVAMAKLHTPEDNPRIVPGAAGAKSPEFKQNLPKAEMRLEGDINKYSYALWHYMQKSPNSPYVGMMLDKLSAELPEMSMEQLKRFPAALQQHMEDLQTTGHTSPDDVRGVFRSTNLDAIFGKGLPTEFQDELADEVEDVTGKQKIRKRK